VPSQRATTTVARQLPATLTDVRAMSMAEGRGRAEQDHQRRPRHARDALAREHHLEHHQELQLQREFDAGGLLQAERILEHIRE
jgi:hypothetical protein